MHITLEQAAALNRIYNDINVLQHVSSNADILIDNEIDIIVAAIDKIKEKTTVRW